jgi:hypothetical protein
MNSLVLITLALGITMLLAAKWTVIRMTQEINRRREPSEWISLAWWPTYKDRQVMKTYHSALPQGRLNVVYLSCISGGIVVLLLAVLLASHSQI